MKHLKYCKSCHSPWITNQNEMKELWAKDPGNLFLACKWKPEDKQDPLTALYSLFLSLLIRASLLWHRDLLFFTLLCACDCGSTGGSGRCHGPPLWDWCLLGPWLFWGLREISLRHLLLWDFVIHVKALYWHMKGLQRKSIILTMINITKNVIL